ncbi:hypothetical protein [Cobetia sp. Dlab-2-AX]|uniref:hypothetical protein n=1 Tax=Cobetia sp. Dlab-2-AX TaxID=2954488 RepID=UPI002096CB9F|nr:hypothetical protein [Cobetia sp. Dlab-2-AX]MCO7232122.1 hypothetical protein [Cobetia sp. Dlab-2-AX]
MHVILLADRLGQEVAPIDRRYSPALLPIAGRSVLERNLDLLVGRGVTHISLIIARDPEWFRARIADGSRWGIDLDILPMPGERDPREQIKRLGAMAALPAPVLRADVLLVPEWFKDDSLAISEQAMASGAPVCHPASVADPTLDRLHWPELRDNPQLGPALLASLSHYHTLVMQALDAADSGLTPHGERGVLPGEQDLHHVYYAAGATRLDESRLTGGFAGITTHVEPGVLLKGQCCLEQGSYVEEGAMLEDCVILPFTRVHGGQQVNAGILFEGEALDGTAPHWFKDRRQAGAASQRGVAYRNPARPEWQERILAALISLATRPFGSRYKELRHRLRQVQDSRMRLFGALPERSPPPLDRVGISSAGAIQPPDWRATPDAFAATLEAIQVGQTPGLRSALREAWRLRQQGKQQ